MAFNVNELNVIRSFIAVTGNAPTQEQLATAMTASSLTAAIREAGIVDTTLPRTAFTEGLYANAGMTADQEGVNYWRGEVSDLGHIRAVAEFQWAAQSDAAFVAKVEAATATLQSTGSDFTPVDGGDEGEGPGLDFDYNVEFSTKEATTGHNTLHSDTSDTVFNLGRDVLDAGQSAITNDYTITLKDQLGTPGTIGAGATATSVATYNAYFLSPIIEATKGQTLGAQLFVRIVDMQAPVNAVEQGLDNVRIASVTFELNEKSVTLAVDPTAINTYEDFLAQLNLALDAQKAENADLNNVTITLGDTFTRQRFDADEQPISGELVTGRDIVIKTSSGTLVAGANNATTAGSTGVISQGQSTQDLGAVAGTIQTNLVLDNVGYGSQGGSVNVSGQSASNKGIDIFNVDAKNGVWLTSLSSSPRVSDDQMLKTINLTGTGSFKVGQQQGTNVVASDNAGLVDVQKFNAGNFNGSIQLDASITNAVIARDLNLVDTANNAAADNVTFAYTTGGQADRVLLTVDGAVAAHEDAVISVNTGAGNDYVHLKLDFATVNQVANQQVLNNVTVNGGTGNNTIWTEGAGNVTIATGGGNDTIYTDNSGGNVTQAGDTVTLTGVAATPTLDMADADKRAQAEALGLKVTGNATDGYVAEGAVNAHWVVNGANNNIFDIQGNGKGADQFLYKGKLTVTFAPTDKALAGVTAAALTQGFEATVDIPTGDNFTVNQRHINQAIKKAINEDAVLSKLLVAKDGPGDSVIIESLIDGLMTTNSIEIGITAPDNTAVAALTGSDRTQVENAWIAFNKDSTNTVVDNDTAITAFTTVNTPLATDGTNAIQGAASTESSSNIVNSGAGNDVIVLGSNAGEADVVVFNTGSIGNNTIVNFEQGSDKLNFTAWLNNVESASGSTASQVPIATGVAAITAMTANGVSVTDFDTLVSAGTLADTITFANLTNANVLAALNADTAFSGADLSTSNLVGTSQKAILLIENSDTAGTNQSQNDGQYKVVEVTFAEAGGDAGFTAANIIGTVDFGQSLTFTAADFV